MLRCFDYSTYPPPLKAMFKKPFSILFALLLGLGMASGQVTNRPYVEERYSRSVQILRVELTSRYTIIDLQYGEPGTRQLFRSPTPRSGDPTIGIDPGSRLYKPGVTSRRYKFIKAEGIAVSPARMNVRPGEVVNFRVYYERLDPGIEIFDFYEGRNPDQTEYWNFYGVHITNPPPRKSVLRTPVPSVKPEIEEPVVQELPLLDEVPAQIPLPTEKMATPEFMGLSGTIYNATTQEAIPGQLVYVEGGDSLRLGTASGKYRLGLDARQKTTISASAKGYLTTTVVVNPVDSTGKASLRYDFSLVPLAEGATVSLNKVYFATSEFQLLPESYDELNGLVNTLRENPSLRIRLEGHTDNQGDFDKNVELSRNRANAVRDYLIQKGIDVSRLEAKGYGQTRPVSKGNSEEERQKNRRVEFIIIGV